MLTSNERKNNAIRKQTKVALVMGVFILSGCESNLTTNSGNESNTFKETVENQEATDDRPMRKPGEINTSKITDLIREVLKEKGRDPNEVRFGELSDKAIALTGEEAWNRYMEDWEFGAKSSSKAGSATNSVIFSPESPITSFSTLPPTPAETQFEVVAVSNPPTSGSITVKYLGEQVTTNYSSGQSASTVAYSIYGNINNDPDIQLTATVPSSGKVLLTEKRDGCDHNGNSVYVSHTNGTHISVNNDIFIMTGGEDVEGCDDDVPPPPDDGDGSNITPIQIAWGSIIDPPAFYGWIDLWSFSAADQNIDYIDVAAYTYKDYIIISSGQDGGYNQDSGIVGTSEYIDPQDSEAYWEQMGDHLFVETNVYYQVPSWAAINF